MYLSRNNVAILKKIRREADVPQACGGRGASKYDRKLANACVFQQHGHSIVVIHSRNLVKDDENAPPLVRKVYVHPLHLNETCKRHTGHPKGTSLRISTGHIDETSQRNFSRHPSTASQRDISTGLAKPCFAAQATALAKTLPQKDHMMDQCIGVVRKVSTDTCDTTTTTATTESACDAMCSTARSMPAVPAEIIENMKAHVATSSGIYYDESRIKFEPVLANAPSVDTESTSEETTSEAMASSPSASAPGTLEGSWRYCKLQISALEGREGLVMDDCTPLLGELFCLASDALEAACGHDSGAMEVYQEATEGLEQVAGMLKKSAQFQPI